MTKPRKKTREELTAKIEENKIPSWVADRNDYEKHAKYIDIKYNIEYNIR